MEYYNGKTLQDLSMIEFNASLTFLQQYFCIVDTSELMTFKSLLDMAREIHKDWQYDGFLIDPYNSLTKDKEALAGITGNVGFEVGGVDLISETRKGDQDQLKI